MDVTSRLSETDGWRAVSRSADGKGLPGGCRCRCLLRRHRDDGGESGLEAVMQGTQIRHRDSGTP